MEFLNHELLNSLYQHAISGFQIETTRYAIGTLTVFLVVWVLLNPLIRHRKIRKSTPKLEQFQRELWNSFRTVLVFVSLDILVFDLATNGGLKIYTDFSDYGVTWFVCSIAIAILLHDTYFYWVHRVMHHPKLFRRLHLTHHRSNNPTPFTAYSFSIGEAAIEYAYTPVLLLLLPMHPSAIAIVLFIMIFKNALGHCGYEIFPKGTTRHPLLKHLTTVTHHDMHHQKAGGNYGFYFTWWDKWMGTEFDDYEARFDAATQSTPNEVRRTSERLPF